MSEQLIVRFRDKSTVVPFPGTSSFNNEEERNKNLVSLWSSRCGWPRERLFVSSWQLPFVQISVVSAIRGGKGGFGTLLKGQSRQAGAKLTTDFGACRDLQGRRLRHVNDEIKLRKWREMEKRKQAGEEVPDDELWKTPSGLYNWHLMTRKKLFPFGDFAALPNHQLSNFLSCRFSDVGKREQESNTPNQAPVSKAESRGIEGS